MSDVTTELAMESNDKAMQIARLKAENAMLREQLAKARDPQRIGGTADPESFVYAIEQLREFRWQHATNDEEAIPYINNVADAHERENAKLREQVERLRTQLADMTESVGRVEERCAKTFEVGKRWVAKAARFEAENAKLRELVRDMAECMDDSQPRCKKCKFRELNCQWFKFDDRMRELGVEVIE